MNRDKYEWVDDERESALSNKNSGYIPLTIKDNGFRPNGTVAKWSVYYTSNTWDFISREAAKKHVESMEDFK